MSTIGAKIVNGGSKLDMIMQLLDKGRVEIEPLFNLMVVPSRLSGSLVKPETIRVRVNGIAAESGGGESWNLQGYIVSAPSWLTDDGQKHLFTAYYQTQRREGSITLI